MAMLEDDEDAPEAAELDPRVREYFDRMMKEGDRYASPEYAQARGQDRLGDENQSIGRAQLAGISEGLSKLGTLNGKSPDVKPLTTTLGAIDQSARERSKGLLADEDDAQKRMGMNAKVYEYLQGRTDKQREAEAGRQFKGEQAGQMQQWKTEQADKMDQLRRDIQDKKSNTIIVNTGAKNDARAEAADAKTAAGDTKRLTEFGNKMNPSLGRQGELGKTQARINAGERVKALALNPDGTIHDLTKGEMTELASSVAALISNGGVASQHVIDSMTPQSMWGNLQAQLSYVTNEVRGSEMQDFTKRLVDTANREIATAKQAKNDAHMQIITSYPDVRSKNEIEWKRIVKTHGFDPEAFDEDFNYAAKAQPPASPPAATPPAAGGSGTAVAAPAALGGMRPIKTRLYSPARNKTKIVYVDGTEEVVDGKQ